MKVYPSKESGTAIVCGSAPCLLKEYEEVRKHRPSAKVLAVNEACHGVWAEFLVSYHAEKLDLFKKESLNPDILRITSKGYKDENEESQIDYRFEKVWIGATSAGDAIQIAKMMGFSEIIMVGCPMNGGDGYFKKTDLGGDCPRFGASETLLGEHRDLVTLHQMKLKKLVEKVDLSMVRSFSGYSAEVLGEWKP